MPVTVAISMAKMAVSLCVTVAISKSAALPISGDVQQIPQFHNSRYFVCFFPANGFFRHFSCPLFSFHFLQSVLLWLFPTSCSNF